MLINKMHPTQYLAAIFLAAMMGTTYAQTGSVPDEDQCDYSNAGLHNGWGWNPVSQQSCPPAENSDPEDPQPASQNHPVCTLASSDPDGDGWGWENNASCVVASAQPPNNPECIDPDGDGWGWDGAQSCRVSEPATAPVCIDSDGDGWGWDGSASCIATETPDADECTPPASGTTLVSSTAPIRSTGNNFYPDTGPQCVVPDNQFNGPGLRFGDFLLLNNAWNGDKSTWDWQQCISLSENNDGSITASWEYDWGDEDALQAGYQEWEVKSYPEIIYGVKSSEEKSAECETTGLPVQFSAMPEIEISYSYSATQTSNRIGDRLNDNGELETVTGGDRNVAIESFLHASCDVQRGENSNRQFELMLWLERGNERLPSGSPPVDVYTATNGNVYDIYVKAEADPGYIAYVARESQTSGTINWNEFFSHAKNNASDYGIRQINDNWCLANILFGSEIWWGEGALSLDYYQIQRSY